MCQLTFIYHQLCGGHGGEEGRTGEQDRWGEEAMPRRAPRTSAPGLRASTGDRLLLERGKPARGFHERTTSARRRRLREKARVARVGVRGSGGTVRARNGPSGRSPEPALRARCADEPRGRRAAGGGGVGISRHGRPGPGELPSGALTTVGSGAQESQLISKGNAEPQLSPDAPGLP